jgi:hypothetical protein
MSTSLILFCAVMTLLLWSHGYTLGRVHGERRERAAWFTGFIHGRRDERHEAEGEAHYPPMIIREVKR